MNKLMLLPALLALSACGPKPAEKPSGPASGPAESAVEAPARLESLVEEYFEESLKLDPIGATFIGDNRYNDKLANSIGPEHRAQEKALAVKYLGLLDELDPGSLAGEDLITWQVARWSLQTELAGERFPSHLLPINQFYSLPSLFVMLGSGDSAQPFVTVRDYDNFLSRSRGFVVWVDQAISNMREGIQAGVVQPRAIMEKVLPQLQGVLTAEPEHSLFWAPVKNMPEDFKQQDRERLRQAYREMIGGTLMPAYRRLHDFIQQEYLPACRETVAWSALPDGSAWYEHSILRSTTLALKADEVHALGLSEVARIRGEMELVARQVGFTGSLSEFFSFLRQDERFYFDDPAALLQGYRDLKQRIDGLLPALFSDFPKADYEVREVEAFRAQSAAGASYQAPSPDGSRPGIFYVNTYNLKAQPKFGMETLSLHEAAPGHHFQSAIQIELEDLPRIRRFGGNVAYNEGWALYAESLGRELGLFTDPYQYYGRLNDEQLRAMRLAVDTGLHAKGWSRQQAIQFMQENSSLAESDIVAEVDRYIVWPGQALGYKIGDLTLQRLRREAAAALGERFDVKQFHSQLLRSGSVPLAVLEAKIQAWVRSQNPASASGQAH